MTEWPEEENEPIDQEVIFPVGRMVFCDICGEDWTDRPEQGGFLFQSKAVCPGCQPQYLASIVEHGEGCLVKGVCPPDQSFADWVRGMRGPDAAIHLKSGPNLFKP